MYGLLLGCILSGLLVQESCTQTQQQPPPQTFREGFFNSTSFVSLSPPLSLNNHIGLSFRSCNGGQLFSQSSSSHYSMLLEVRPDGLFFIVSIRSLRFESKISVNLLDNEWHTVNIIHRLGSLNMSVDNYHVIIANMTHNSKILTQTELYSDKAALVVGSGFSGCLLEGPSIVFDPALMSSHGVIWGPCPLPTNSACNEEDHCAGEPCMKHGRCISLPGKYLCQCTARYSGTNCHIDNGPPCERNPCKNNGVCIEDKTGDFTCNCLPGFTGKDCGIELTQKLCDNNPCQHNSTCRPIAGPPQYECICLPGFTGKDCEANINECLSNPCQHGGTCIDGINSYSCFCARTGYTGANCELNINECESSPCMNNGICFDNYGGYTCQCPPGFGGQNCDMRFSDCASNPCNNVANSVCIDTPSSYLCVCKPGYRGMVPNCIKIEECSMNNPCKNGATCTLNGDTFMCICPPGFTGHLCETNIDDCSSSPCQNGGTCLNGPEGFFCNCTLEFSGPHCELNSDICSSVRPCLNNGTCVPTGDGKQYHCECLKGFEGVNCETNIDDCLRQKCGADKICKDGINSFECVCANGMLGDNCSQDQLPCSVQPCKNGATCVDTGGNYTCTCPEGYTGFHCDVDIDECAEDPNICNHGVCFNKDGYYQCFCTPGFSGDNCNVDFDECLSNPCANGASCQNLVNKFNCICPPGYTGRDCGINIDECESNPCTGGATCIDGIATFYCVCPLGLTGLFCETNIDDCESSPCLNEGVCIDGLNSYTCNCSDTGFEGEHCEINIEDCASSPCQNGGICIDEIKGYKCECFKGFEGIDCEIDINECDSVPCQNGGTCLERSNQQYYNAELRNNIINVTEWPEIFSKPYSFATASGFECLCIEGINGTRCENNINDCDPNPCRNGQCIDKIAYYICDCEEGFEGVNCEINIDECERYTPCVHGTCIDKRAGYDCDCDPKYGGKNCSVELMGCFENQCQNNGTCTPYLENETVHKFNCSCPNGFHGDRCEKETTMSVNGNSYVMVNTSRDEGYDISFRFKTTLSSGLLAVGKGSTYYILELSQGRLNLHTSLLNKWEGVFIGSKLNDSNWHKVFVAINSSHLVLSANEEQTIYPISQNEGGSSNASHTSFPTTYVGGTISYLRFLSHGPMFTGCIQDVIINNQWVLPEDPSNQDPISFVSVDVGCHRTEQCAKTNDPANATCHNGGHCTDLWNTFSCTCQRPFLGHTCQYNLTAATFGHENITDSLVTVTVDSSARRAVRSILDISMFIRTRDPTGGIFYLGSIPNSVTYQEETVISARLSGGELQVQIQFNATPEKYTVGGVRLDNGYNHLIQVVRNVTLVQVKINGTEYFRKTISATGQLDLQVLQLGSAPDVPSEPNFKGVIQDVQVSNGSRVMVVEFFPLLAEDLAIPPPLGQVQFDNNLVLEGIVSDNSCASMPCMHGGTCSVTWNDFSCKCTVGFKGKQCEEMEFCQVQDCPTGSECRNLNHGYECVANITIHNLHPLTSSGMYYTLVEGRQRVGLDDIAITYRSKTGGVLLQIGPDHLSKFFLVSVFKDLVTIWWDLGDVSDKRTLSKELAEGAWVTITLEMKESSIAGSNGDQSFVANFSLASWQSLVSKANITVGAGSNLMLTDRHLYTTYSDSDHTNAVEFASHHQQSSDPSQYDHLASPYRGCLGEVRIGGLLLPYFTNEELNLTNPDERDRFEMSPGALEPDQVGCMLCFNEECFNGGSCKNATELYICDCKPGFEGDDCSENIDECAESDCKNNSTCIDGLATYTCACLPGWQGSLCDKEIDECASGPCENGGTCIDHVAHFKCLCPPDFIGETCSSLRIITCANQPCYNGAQCLDEPNPLTHNNFTCDCAEGFVGTTCENAFCDEEDARCQNGGHCASSLIKPVCKCLDGYTGRLCEINIDECASSPCQNGASCTDGIARFTCHCVSGFTGPLCDTDIDECATSMIDCGDGAECINTVGSYKCNCPPPKCGPTCNLLDPCQEIICENGGSCVPECDVEPDYICHCPVGFTGKNCTLVSEYGATQFKDIALIVGPLLAIILIAGAASLTVFLMMARKKRATRGTYSPSSQEYCNPRVELDNVMKPPPEERLI